MKNIITSKLRTNILYDDIQMWIIFRKIVFVFSSFSSFVLVSSRSIMCPNFQRDFGSILLRFFLFHAQNIIITNMEKMLWQKKKNRKEMKKANVSFVDFNTDAQPSPLNVIYCNVKKRDKKKNYIWNVCRRTIFVNGENEKRMKWIPTATS